MSYKDIISNAPNPELADKIMCALYILSKGKPNIEIQQSEIMNLVQTMDLDELRRNAKKIQEAKSNDKLES